MSWSVFTQQPTQPAEPELHQQLFPKYELRREKLEAWLERKFPDYVGKFEIEVFNRIPPSSTLICTYWNRSSKTNMPFMFRNL
jgi:hypothetical protein